MPSMDAAHAAWVPTDTNHHVFVRLQPEEKDIAVPREKAKNVERLLCYLGLRMGTAIVARDGIPLTHDVRLDIGDHVLVRSVMSRG